MLWNESQETVAYGYVREQRESLRKNLKVDNSWKSNPRVNSSYQHISFHDELLSIKL